MRVAIVGAGASGLAAARHVTAEGIHCEVFEMRSELGGTWIYTDDTKTDQYGFPVYSAMYKDLRTNLPKEVMGYPDFPIPEQERSFLTQPEILDFLNAYADHFNLKPLIKFNQLVTDVRPLNDKWQVTTIDKPTKTESIAIFDAIMICNGHYNEPVIPNLPGIENFKGEIIHSREYRKSEPFAGQRVLIIGAGPSGFDLVYHIAAEAQNVAFSKRNRALTTATFPSNVTIKPDVLLVNNDGEVEFVDNSCASFDTIIYCTGYKYSFPFLHESCGVTVDQNFVQPLYKHMVHIEKPTMCFIGIPTYICAFQMFDIQARFYCKYLTGAMILPSKEVMRKDMEDDMQNRLKQGYTKEKAHYMYDFQIDYFKDLANAANVTPIMPVIPKLYMDCVKRILGDLDNFRKDVYKIVDNENYIVRRANESLRDI